MVSKILRLVEILALALFFGFLPVLLCVAAAGFVNVIFLEEKGIAYWALAGLVVGLIIDCLFVKSWVTKAYQMNSKILAALYIFYSIGALGFCMGIPLLNFALGIAAGAYAARKMYHSKAGPAELKRGVKKVSIFAAAVMALICCLMALWAAVGGVIGSRFETPILSFTFTVPIFIAVVLAGGAALVLLQYWLTRLAARVTFKLHTLKAGPRIAGAVVALIALAGLIGLGWLGLQCYRAHRKQAAQQAKQRVELQTPS